MPVASAAGRAVMAAAKARVTLRTMATRMRGGQARARANPFPTRPLPAAREPRRTASGGRSLRSLPARSRDRGHGADLVKVLARDRESGSVRLRIDSLDDLAH